MRKERERAPGKYGKLDRYTYLWWCCGGVLCVEYNVHSVVCLSSVNSVCLFVQLPGVQTQTKGSLRSVTSHLPACMPACLPACLSVYLLTCLSACLFTCLSICLCQCLIQFRRKVGQIKGSDLLKYTFKQWSSRVPP